MQITDSTIISIDKEALLKRETLLSLLDIQEPEERARLSALLELRAKEMGLQKEFKTVLKAYVQADEELAKEWKRANAKKRARIDLDFDGNGRPLASINNFLQVLENDPKFASALNREVTRVIDPASYDPETSTKEFFASHSQFYFCCPKLFSLHRLRQKPR